MTRSFGWRRPGGVLNGDIYYIYTLLESDEEVAVHIVTSDASPPTKYRLIYGERGEWEPVGELGRFVRNIDPHSHAVPSFLTNGDIRWIKA
jgi:hypothetical protein